jgi:GAF domain-containing protein
MSVAPIPSNDQARLRALYELLILDTPPEQRFDRIVAFAAQEFDMPMVLLTLVDSERQWFKAKVGMDVCETSRDSAFCAHAILTPETMEVRDALKDPRFVDNPLVVGEPHIRFYAGAPLEVKPGLRLGTLCLIDRVPRQLDRTDLAILDSLRDLVVAELRGHSLES